MSAKTKVSKASRIPWDSLNDHSPSGVVYVGVRKSVGEIEESLDITEILSLAFFFSRSPLGVSHGQAWRLHSTVNMGNIPNSISPTCCHNQILLSAMPALQPEITTLINKFYVTMTTEEMRVLFILLPLIISYICEES